MILFCTFWGRVLLRSLRVYILKQLFFLKPRWIVAEYLPRFQRIANCSVSPVLWTESVILCLHRLDVTEVHLEKKPYWHFSSCSFGLDGKIKQIFVVRLFRCVGTARGQNIGTWWLVTKPLHFDRPSFQRNACLPAASCCSVSWLTLHIYLPKS